MVFCGQGLWPLVRSMQQKAAQAKAHELLTMYSIPTPQKTSARDPNAAGNQRKTLAENGARDRKTQL